MSRPFRVIAACIALMAAIGTTADAGLIVVGNLGEFLQSGGGIAGGAPFGPRGSATQFTAGPGDWSIDSITLRIQELTGNNPDAVSLRILNDNGGAPGTTVLGSLASVSNITSLGNYAFTPLAPITLTGSTSYWLAGFPTIINSSYAWGITLSEAETGAPGWSIGTNIYGSTNNGASWTLTDSRSFMFQIEATQAVPEPASVVLLGLGAIGVFAAKRRSGRRERSAAC